MQTRKNKIKIDEMRLVFNGIGMEKSFSSWKITSTNVANNTSIIFEFSKCNQKEKVAGERAF